MIEPKPPPGGLLASHVGRPTAKSDRLTGYDYQRLGEYQLPSANVKVTVFEPDATIPAVTNAVSLYET
jgi:hypothetical protein